ncbi:MAG: V-type ATPase subunit [Candidatus Hadarchaeota archaeon]
MIEIAFVLALSSALLVGVLLSARKSMNYLFCNATVSAWEAKLVSETRMMELADTPSLQTLLSALEDTEHRSWVAEVRKNERPDIAEVERALYEHRSAKYRELLGMLPDERKKTVQKILERTDAWNLKAIITMIHNSVPKESRLRELAPSPTMPRERLEMLVSAGDLNELLEFLKGSEYFGVVSGSLEDYKINGLLPVLTAIDRQYYSTLWADVQSKKAQRKILAPIVGFQIDSLNVELILRLKSEGVAAQEIDGHLIRPSHELTEPMLREMMKAEDVRSTIHMIHITTPAKALEGSMAEIEEKGPAAAEKALEESHVKLSKWFGFTQFFSIAPVLSYIAQKDNEVRNLRAIIRLKAEGIEPQEIKEMIRRVPKVEL